MFVGTLQVRIDFFVFSSATDMLTTVVALKKKSWNLPEGAVDGYHTLQDDAKRPFAALHLDIQIYEMEHGVYLVDFKCSGYENAQGRLLEEKDVTSPFPFLDMAAKLIMQLAEAD